MSLRARAPFALTVLVLGGLGAYVAARFAVTTDITALMPPTGDRERVAIARRITESELARTMVLTLGAPDSATLVEASRTFEAVLRKEPRVGPALASLEGGPPEGTERAIYELYHPRRLGFLADSAAAARAELSPDALRGAAQRLKQRLGQPMSPLLSRLAPTDPLLVLTRLFERVEGSQGSALRMEDGRFVTLDGGFAVLFLGTRAAAFDSQAQTPLIEGIQAAFAQTNARFGGKLSLDQSGVNRFAVRAERAIKGDIERVSTLSTVGLLALMFALFRSLRFIGAAMIPMGAGFVVGVASCLALYGQVHGITLAFGASLLGVTVDYVEHVYCHHAVAPHANGVRGTLRAIGPALLTGAATTLVGFMALAGAGFRGLEEVAVFSSTGIVAALITTFTTLPALLPRVAPQVALRTRIVASLGRLFGALRAHRRRLWVLPALSITIAALGLPKVHLSEDFMRAQLDPDLLAEDQRVRGRIARFDQMRFVVARGADEDAALQVNDRLAGVLDAAVADGELKGFRGVASLLPSASRQRSVADAVRAALGDGTTLVSAFEAEGFRGEALAPFLKSLADPQPAPLTFGDLAASPLAPLVRPFRVNVDGGVGFVSFLHDVADPAALAARLAPIDGVLFIDQAALYKDMYRAYQQRTLEWLGIGLAGVLLLIALRYRDARKTLAAFLPSLLAAAVTVATLALAGYALDLVALAALLMVVSMGVDYGVFLVDAADEEEAPTTALLSVFLASLTTLLGFGVLAISTHPMLSVIGLTACVGMFGCLVLAPTTLVLLGRSTEAHASPENLRAET